MIKYKKTKNKKKIIWKNKLMINMMNKYLNNLEIKFKKFFKIKCLNIIKFKLKMLNKFFLKRYKKMNYNKKNLESNKLINRMKNKIKYIYMIISMMKLVKLKNQLKIIKT
jgi:hypothetical protein